MSDALPDRFLVEIGGRWLTFDDRGAMATGAPYIGVGIEQAREFTTVENAMSAVTQLRARERAAGRCTVHVVTRRAEPLMEIL